MQWSESVEAESQKASNFDTKLWKSSGIGNNWCLRHVREKKWDWKHEYRLSTFKIKIRLLIFPLYSCSIKRKPGVYFWRGFIWQPLDLRTARVVEGSTVTYCDEIWGIMEKKACTQAYLLEVGDWYCLLEKNQSTQKCRPPGGIFNQRVYELEWEQ